MACSRRAPTRPVPGALPHHGQRTVRAAPRDPRPARRAGPGPDDERPRRPDLPDDVVRLRRHTARRRPLRPEGARQHLHADHEPDAGRARAAPRRARGRHRVGRDRVRPVRGPLLRPERHARGRQLRLGLDALRRDVQPLRAHAAAVRHRGALGRPGRPRAARVARRRQDPPGLRRDDRQPARERRRPARLGRRRPRARACRWSSTTPSRRPSCAAPSTTAPTSRSTPPRSSSAATAPRSAAWSSTAARSTGPRTPTASPG